MTPAQLDHLRRIDAHLAKLLDIAAKRTPGEWLAASESVWAKDEEDERVCDRCGGWDPDFIASCSSNAEAGWKATRAAIAHLCIFADGGIPMSNPTQNLLQSIFAAFPSI